MATAVSIRSAYVVIAGQNTGVDAAQIWDASLNTLPPASFLIGCGILTFGFWPRLVGPILYALLAWSFLLQMVGSAINLNYWRLDASIFHHGALAPATGPKWLVNAVLMALGLIGCGVGLLRFTRRDLASEWLYVRKLHMPWLGIKDLNLNPRSRHQETLC